MRDRLLKPSDILEVVTDLEELVKTTEYSVDEKLFILESLSDYYSVIRVESGALNSVGPLYLIHNLIDNHIKALSKIDEEQDDE